MVADIRFLNTYQQFLEQADRNIQNLSTNSRLSCNVTKIPVIEPDNRVYSDINKVKDTFEKAIDTTQQVKVQVNELDHKALSDKERTKLVFSALSPVVPFRRITSVPDKLEDKDYLGTAGTIAVAGLLLPEDLRDTKDALRQVLNKALPDSFKGKIENRYPKIYDNFIKYNKNRNYKDYQTPFSFIRGSFLEKFVNKFMCNKYGYALYEWDKTLLDTRFGETIRKLFKVEKVGSEYTGRIVKRVTKTNKGKYIIADSAVQAVKYEGSWFGKLICRGLQRTTKMGTLTLVIISLPAVVKAFIKPKKAENKLINGVKQTAKSAVNVVSTLSGIGLVGALLAPLGPVGSVTGMAIGSTLGAYSSSQINKNIKTEN